MLRMRAATLWVFLLYATWVEAWKAHVDPEVHRSLTPVDPTDVETSLRVNIFVSMAKGIDGIERMRHMRSFSTRGERINAIATALEKSAKASQAGVFRLLETHRRRLTEGNNNNTDDDDVVVLPTAESFWITNEVYIAHADDALVASLSALKGVGSIRKEGHLNLPEPRPMQASAERVTNKTDVEWSVRRIQADKAWSLLGQSSSSKKTGGPSRGFGIQDIIVGSIDSGVHGTHEALRESFRGAYGWYDPILGSTKPVDTHGHGTHTMGTMVGSKGIGVAPGARWMACRACTVLGCSEVGLVKCGQFMACPTDVRSGRRDCAQAPHVVSNSWGGGQGVLSYAKIVQAWHEMGIIPVFAAGNAGPACTTVESPGDLPNVISVGATTSADTLAWFSSTGPVVKGGGVKPDVVAPGENVRSAFPSFETNDDDDEKEEGKEANHGMNVGQQKKEKEKNSQENKKKSPTMKSNKKDTSNRDNAYAADDGSSMACPAVSGVIALMLAERQGNLSFAQVKEVLFASTDTASLHETGEECGGRSESTFPNNAFGYGRVNALKAIEILRGIRKASKTKPSPQPKRPRELSCYYDVTNYGVCHPLRWCVYDSDRKECVPKRA